MIEQYFKIIKEKNNLWDNNKFIQAGFFLMNSPTNANLLISVLIENTNLFDQREVINFFHIIS